MRAAYIVGGLYLLFCGSLLAFRSNMGSFDTKAHPVRSFSGSAAQWFVETKPYCNSVEIENRIAHYPPPSNTEGQAYSAACFALAGNPPRARSILSEISTDKRPAAAEILFEVVHPVADAGDDKSAGSVMELVLQFSPDNYMALYHAGIAEYNLRQFDTARAHLNRFLELYRTDDGWRRNAQQAVDNLN